ncbi:hypothetical protein [Streptomyces chartreusis]|uniref:hypothetical protein n=1 Tax=Streptomyces chartreusis TaxID=1969 RepID=UPI00123DAB55|nr:hypothetical protein [Streptomyces chartreusis]QEV68136.1 hypothetical protein CP983_16565 [Streptomyces chartreusis]GGX33670.1 hypothetical protein GCM10010321_55820 [Streptomyces chartreusis]
MTGALAAALALLVWGAAAPASAGGPTSVLLVSPESTETASLYYSDKEYGQLERLLGSAALGTRNKPPEAALEAARQINVTWMVHDVSPWRLDRVYPVDDGKDVWIHTASDLGSTTNGTWHRAHQPSKLRALLSKLGLMGKASSEGGAAIFPPDEEASGTDNGAQDSPSAADETTSAASGSGSGPGTESGSGAGSASASASSDGTDWWWALPGAAAGAVLALALRPLALRLPLDRLRGEPGPRQELRDV